MFFLTIILKNLLRRRTRSLLTITGIAIGVAAFVALASLAWGFQASWERTYAVRGTDVIVTKVTSQSPMPTPFYQSVEAQVRQLPGVRNVTGLLSDLFSIEDAPSVLVFGWERGSFLWQHLTLFGGRWPTNDNEQALVLGTMAAQMLNKSLGDPIQIETQQYTVCGIFSSPSLLENGAVILTLQQMQRVTDNEGKVNFLNLRLEPTMTSDQVETLRHTIKARLPGFNAFTGDEIGRNNTAIQMAKTTSLAISTVALAVSAVGIMNTMLMSVFERIQEIGILRAIGWRRSRILRMVLFESLFQSLAGGVAGIGLGWVAVKLLALTPWMRGKIEGEVGLPLFAAALLIALVIGNVGGLYPAYRGSRLNPSEALRYE